MCDNFFHCMRPVYFVHLNTESWECGFFIFLIVSASIVLACRMIQCSSSSFLLRPTLLFVGGMHLAFFFFSLHCTLSTPVFATLSARALVLHSILSRGCCVVFKGVRIFHLGARKSKRRLGNNYKWPMHSFAVAVMPCFSADAGDCNKVREVNGAESTIMHSFVMKRAGFARGQKNATHTYLARSWVHLLLLLSAP